MTSEGSHIWPPSIEESSGKLSSLQGIIGRLFCSKVDKIIYSFLTRFGVFNWTPCTPSFKNIYINIILSNYYNACQFNVDGVDGEYNSFPILVLWFYRMYDKMHWTYFLKYFVTLLQNDYPVLYSLACIKLLPPMTSAFLPKSR